MSELDEKYAVLSMDVEDWYHLAYFVGKADTTYSMLDGFTNYIELLNRHNIKTTFFVLSELVDSIKEEILYAVSCGHEIACHGKTHTRPIDLSLDDFEREITDAKAKLEDTIGKEVIGFRAPCYGIDNERYRIVQKAGFKYSSSKMDIPGHPLYGKLELSSFNQPIKGVYTDNIITEFALSAKKYFGFHVAVSGGGWIRLLPWRCFMKPLLKCYLEGASCYTLYIHPFELSYKQMPRVPNTGLITNIRARKGREKVKELIEQLICILQENKFCFATFSDLYNVINASI